MDQECQRPMTWNELCDEMVRQRTRAEKAEKALELAEMKAYNRGVCCFEDRQPMLEELDRKDVEIARLKEVGNTFIDEIETKDNEIVRLQAETIYMQRELRKLFEPCPPNTECFNDCGNEEACETLKSDAGKPLLDYVTKLEQVAKAANNSSIMNRYRDGISVYEVDQMLIDALANLNKKEG